MAPLTANLITELTCFDYAKQISVLSVLCAYCIPLLFFYYLVVSYRCYRLRWWIKMNIYYIFPFALTRGGTNRPLATYLHSSLRSRLGPTRAVCLPNILTGSAVFAGFTVVTNMQTDHASYNLRIEGMRGPLMMHWQALSPQNGKLILRGWLTWACRAAT